LDIEALALDLGVELPHLFYALTKLTSDNLLVREPGRGFAVRPLDAQTADQALEARCAIEIAVVERIVGTIEDADVAELRVHAEAAGAAVAAEPPDLGKLRTTSRAFHAKLVSLMGNEILADVYRRLGIDAIWGRALVGAGGRRYISPDYLLRLTDACADHDAELAKRLIYDHTVEVRAIAFEAMARVGGTM
jgi:DNA-binding GntR family transcriptional regulator